MGYNNKQIFYERGICRESGKIFEKLVPGLLDIYGELLVSILLYGSVARGTQTEESDVDIAVIIKSGSTKEMNEEMTDLVVDLELEYDKVLSILRIEYEMFKEWENILPFYKNVKKEGVVLWQAA